MSKLGWQGKQVRHRDGRTGVIRAEYVGFGYVLLNIDATNGSEAVVLLNAHSGDGGATGWAWLCENFSGGPHWLPLGDHNDFAAEPAVSVPAA